MWDPQREVSRHWKTAQESGGRPWLQDQAGHCVYENKKFFIPDRHGEFVLSERVRGRVTDIGEKCPP